MPVTIGRRELLAAHGGAAAYLIVVERGGKRRLSLGHHPTIEEAKACCEQHFADGCDVSGAERW